MLYCLFYICSSNFPIHIWNKAQQGKWKISHFYDQMSKCCFSRMENMWGLYLVLEGGPYLHIQFHEFFTTSNFSRPSFSQCSPFLRRFSWSSPFFTTLEIHDSVSRHFHRSMKFHDLFTTFLRCLPPVVFSALLVAKQADYQICQHVKWFHCPYHIKVKFSLHVL